MARNPYGKRIAQGAASGAVTGAAAGTMILPGIGTAVGAGLGALGGGFMARPGDDEKRLRARMRKLEMGVLGDEATAIRQRFMNPVRGAAQEQEVRRRALEQGTALSGAAARRGQAAQRAARGDIAEAGQEATLAVMDLEEQRRQQAQRINEGLIAQAGQRDRAFRQGMMQAVPMLAGELGSTIGAQRGLSLEEAALLPGAASNAADLQAISSEDPMFDPAVSDPMLPEAGGPVAAGTAAPPRSAGDLLEAAYADAGDPMLFGSAVDPAPAAPAAAPAAPAPTAYSAAETSQALAALGVGSASMEFPETSIAAPAPVDEFLAGLSQKQRDEIPVYYSKMPALQSLDVESQKTAIGVLNRMNPATRDALDWDSYNEQLSVAAGLE